jgi:SAM-dependent methyltransferase
MKRLANFFRTCSRLGVSGTVKLVRATILAPIVTWIGWFTIVGFGRLESMRRALARKTHVRMGRGDAMEIAELDRASRVLDVLHAEPAPARARRAASGGTNYIGTPMHLTVPRSVRRTYSGRTDVFHRELDVMRKLGRLPGVSVPEILDVDFDEPALVTSFVGTEHVTSGIPRDTVMALGDELHRIHRAGVVLGGFSPNMVAVDPEGKPWWVDFTTATDYSKLPWEVLRFLADIDVESFNQVFGTSYPTYQEMRAMARSRSLSQYFGSYSPAYLGAGIRTGPIWSLGTGWGRWESLLRRSLPDPAGMRVLDLGANNGHNGFEMLRCGADEVVGIERNPERVAQGDHLKQAYEWADGRRYPYVGYQADMRDATRLGLGEFDMVTALCSLYYLAEDEMIRLVSELREIAPIVVLECNQRRSIGRSDPDTYRKASLEFNLRVLNEGGFEEVEVIAPRWSQRPLLIGRR